MKSTKADVIVRKAEGKLKGFMSFFIGADYEIASELFQKAASIFKAEGSWASAASAFKRSAECCQHLEYSYEACSNFCEAAAAYRKEGRISEALECWSEAQKLFVESNRFHQAGKVECEIGDMYAGVHDYSGAIKHYNKGIFYYLTDDHGKNLALRVQKKLAMIFVESGNLAGAAQEFDKLASCEQHRCIRSLAREYYFCSFLCEMGLLRRDNLHEGIASVREKVGILLTKDSSLIKTREFELIEDVCKAVESKMPDEVRQSISSYSEIKHLDDWKVSILHGLVQMIEIDDER